MGIHSVKELLILVGPQGAGNHLFSKVFALHPDVYGWPNINATDTRQGHRRTEPFRNVWNNSLTLSDFDFSTHDYFVTSVSYPIGSFDNKLYPDITAFAEAAEKQGINVVIAVIGRDKTILHHQQTRIRETPSLDEFLDNLETINNPIFLSYELLYLYGSTYLRSLHINIPISYDDPHLAHILKSDANERYISPAESTDLDDSYPIKG